MVICHIRRLFGHALWWVREFRHVDKYIPQPGQLIRPEQMVHGLIGIHALHFRQHGSIIVLYLIVKDLKFTAHGLTYGLFVEFQLRTHRQRLRLVVLPIRLDDFDRSRGQFFGSLRRNTGGFHLRRNGSLSALF